MSKAAVQFKVVAQPEPEFGGQVIDLRTRQPWRRPDPPPWPFLLDVALIFSLVTLGAWLFLKMRGG